MITLWSQGDVLIQVHGWVLFVGFVVVMGILNTIAAKKGCGGSCNCGDDDDE